MSKRAAIIVDLDGTLYDARDRQQRHLLSGKKDFDAFHRDAKNDYPHRWCAQLLLIMKEAGYFPVFTSGRDDTYRMETETWLLHYLGWRPFLDTVGQYILLMRPAGDYTADDVMKEQWLKQRILPEYDVLFAVDDRKRVADMWRRNGITCLHCDDGNF